MPTLDFKHVAILLAYAVITAVLNLIFSKRSQIDEWCEANPKLAAFAKLLRGIGIDPWTIFQSLVLAFTKKLPDYQKQSLVELKASKPYVPPMPMLVICLAAFALGGCSAGLTPKTIDQAAIILCDSFFREHPKVGISPKEVEQALCSTADQLEPFLASAKMASEHGGAVRLQRSEQP